MGKWLMIAFVIKFAGQIDFMVCCILNDLFDDYVEADLIYTAAKIEDLRQNNMLEF